MEGKKGRKKNMNEAKWKEIWSQKRVSWFISRRDESLFTLFLSSLSLPPPLPLPFLSQLRALFCQGESKERGGRRGVERRKGGRRRIKKGRKE